MDDQTLIDRYHAQPGKTHSMLEGFRDAEGRSSYEVLAEETDALPRDARVLDLACGDGYLLALLAQRGFGDLAGVDRSAEELAAARARLGAGADLRCEDASALSLPEGSVDIVVCHMALMLMAPIEPILAEVGRVLAPGGLFISVVNRPLRDPVFAIHRREVGRVTAEAGMLRLRLGDSRVYAAEGLRDLLHAGPFDPERVHLRDFVVRARATPERFASMLALVYDVFRLPAPQKAALEQRLLGAWTPLAGEDGLLTCSMGMRLSVCRRAAPR
ncbi:class I SAM-dependent methyltransferase [Sorangium sp. So ce381]|uniref:class I SAM-dependent methyltransferase n=1 Tax=Sorangium sp. So ce381 TaxID=3133307 RepID=UPI003F5C4CCE